MPEFASVLAGDPAPFFRQRSPTTESFTFDTAAGRFLLLCFLGSAGSAPGARALAAMLSLGEVFDDERAACFFVSNDPADEALGRLANRVPGFRVFWDFDLSVARLYGAAARDGQVIRPLWVLIDPNMRVRRVLPFAEDGSDIDRLSAELRALPPPERFAGFPLQAPILVLPQVFEPEFCDRLIGLYEAAGGVESGFMREIDGRTVPVHDHGHKRRRDHVLEDEEMIAAIRARFVRRVVSEIRKAHQFEVTRMERYLVACYDSEEGGHFRAHRDNTTKGTAHRRFAVSINLNEEFDGGEVSFPEYGARGFKAPKGGAVVFSCSLLHAVSPVTRGRRFAFLPFLYDDAAAALRERNLKYIAEAPAAG